jgi:predicted acetyltransferase
MQIRRADRSDIRRVAELWIHSFPGERTLAERMHMLETGGAWGGIETVHVVDDGHALAGALKLQEMTQYFGGEGIPMMGLAAVAVSSGARRRGVGKDLCEYALRVAAERGDALSVLYPFRPEFYARFGWALVGEIRRYRFRPEALAIDVAAPVRLAAAEDENGIRACYERFAHRSNGLVARGPRAWRQHLDAPGVWAYVHDDDGITGYMLVRYGRSRSPQRKPLVVREVIADDDTAYRSLLGWIPRQRDLWRRVHYDAWPDERFDLLLSDPRPPGHVAVRWLWNPTARVLQGPMLRILDVKSAFERRGSWGSKEPVSFTLDVRDTHLPRNHGTFRVEWNGSETQLERVAAADAGTRIALDIGTLAQLYAGEIGLTNATRAHRAVVEGDAAGVEAFFAARSSFRLLDEF